jgi:hypothetical protein
MSILLGGTTVTTTAVGFNIMGNQPNPMDWDLLGELTVLNQTSGSNYQIAGQATLTYTPDTNGASAQIKTSTTTAVYFNLTTALALDIQLSGTWTVGTAPFTASMTMANAVIFLTT